jgi:hypothetical protein
MTRTQRTRIGRRTARATAAEVFGQLEQRMRARGVQVICHMPAARARISMIFCGAADDAGAALQGGAA